MQSPSGDTLGAACLINDQTELARVREQQAMRGEMSAEMALAVAQFAGDHRRLRQAVIERPG